MDLIDLIAIGVWITVAIISLGIFLFFIDRYLKFKEKNRIQLAFCLIFLCLGIGRLLLIYFDYFLTGLEISAYDEFQLMWKTAILFEMVGIGFLILVSEYAVWKGKDFYSFFIGFLIVVCIGMCIPDFFLGQMIIVYALIFAVFIPISYIYLAIKLPKPSRSNIIMVFIGFIIFGGGLLLISAGVVEWLAFLIDNHSLYLISAIVQIPGLLFLALGIKRMYFTEMT
ncbi:MAG TPA: hypothetical protein VMV49_00335 [Candidatus Deferrimicrobium sp.]|nr:hypothetical protein [Candidatus Deferrimicrobium sp.]